MNYSNIKYFDIANGTGVRTSLFVSGCTHRCKGCFNEVAWDFNAGSIFNKEIEDEIIKSLEPTYISGLSLLGGEPLEIVNQRGLIIANKTTLENVLGILFLKKEKEELDKILKNLPNKDNLNTTLKEPKNRSIALDLIFAADKVHKRGLYDMEISDKFRLRFGLADEKEIQKEVDLIIYNLARVEDILQKIAPIIEKQKNYLDIYNSIRLDKINSQTYKSTYISYVIIMVLCLYSLTKTSRKNSVVS